MTQISTSNFGVPNLRSHLMDAMNELHYTIDTDNNNFELARKKASHCNSFHCKSLIDLFNRYFSYFDFIKRGDDIALEAIESQAIRVNMSVDEFIENIKKMYNDILMNNPEKFI